MGRRTLVLLLCLLGNNQLYYSPGEMMTINLKAWALAIVLIGCVPLLSECTGTPPDMAPAATQMHELYREGLIHRSEMIEQGRALHPQHSKLVV